ncbi:S26 family signal peptidase [Halopenitus sp. POP-27]|uniref:S26 family signal peptidase n=1 Tax=Halopenitus sp. POP-27 TaxID=2994425 RepID=UPI002469B2FB|nr:S26 family signal peptidase [Halopenitus sp. POP-27]
MGSGNEWSGEPSDDDPGSDARGPDSGSDGGRRTTDPTGDDRTADRNGGDDRTDNRSGGDDRTDDDRAIDRDRDDAMPTGGTETQETHSESGSKHRDSPAGRPSQAPETTAAAERGRERDRGRERGLSRSTGGQDRGSIREFLTATEGPAVWIRDVVSSVLIVLAIGALLFAVTGVWPPMVAVESGSMDPNMQKGDLIVVTEPGRLAPAAATNDVGVVPAAVAEREGYRSFGAPGSVIVYTFPGRIGSPIIHRTMFHVEAGENWVDRADDRYLSADTCSAVQNCPAPHSGYITKGDNNGRYDQASGIAPPVKPEWVTGVARVRLPYLGWIRLVATGQATMDEAVEAVTSGTLGWKGMFGVPGAPDALAIAGSTAIGSAAVVGTAAVRRRHR